jgi:hypothetical protein
MRPERGKTVVLLLTKPDVSCPLAYLTVCPSINQNVLVVLTPTQLGSIGPRGRLKPHELISGTLSNRAA